MAARLSDIAQLAGVSEATVSRVLNDRPGVAAAKRQAVLTALDRLGYERPARLRRRTGRQVGLVLPELWNPIFPAFAQAMGSNLARRGFTPVLGTQSDGGVHEDEYVDMLVEGGAAGIVFVCGLHSDSAQPIDRYVALRERNMPLAFVNGYREGIDAPFYGTDDIESASMAVRHLASLGHERIGLAAGQLNFVAAERKREGFVSAMAELFGPDAPAPVEASAFTDHGGMLAGRALIAQGCTAIVCASDIIALGVLAEAKHQGLVVPRDVSVVGFDDSPLPQFTWPPLTTVRQPVSALSIAAIDALIGHINGIPATRTEHLFRPELVVRESTGIPGR